jgi:hypothetical protein
LTEDDEYVEDDEYDEEQEEEEEPEYQEEEEQRSVVREITDYEQGKTTYLYDNGTYEDVYHEEPSDCFLATACYGSALDQHVVFLRRFRDLEVMRTRVGRNFMQFFNTIYYSFSPTLASYLRRHRAAKLVMRYAAVAPIIYLLRLSRDATNPISRVSREARIVTTGAAFVIGLSIIGWVLLSLISQLLGLL